MKITVPSALRDSSAAPVVGMGPYVIEHNGERELGSMLYQYPDGTFTVQDMARVLEIDDGYSVKVEGDALVFKNDSIRSYIKVRPVELEDRVWIFPDTIADGEVTREQLEEAAFELLDFPTGEDEQPTALTAAAAPPAASTFITLDDTDAVLELARSDAEGIYIRSNGQWFMLDPTAEEEDTPSVWNREWVNVGEGAVDAFDAAEQADQQLKRSDFGQFIIAQ